MLLHRGKKGDEVGNAVNRQELAAIDGESSERPLMLIPSVESIETVAETLNWNESLSFSHGTHTLTVFGAT